MTAKEYLSGIRKKRLHCRTLATKLEELEEMAKGVKAIRYDRDNVQTTPENSMEKYLAEYMDVRIELSKALVEYGEQMAKAEWQIEAMPNPIHAEVLRLRYIDDDNGRRMTFERISCIMHRSFDWVRHLHVQALKEFERRYL